MCFMNCPYEDHLGECKDTKMMGTSQAGCHDDSEKGYDDEWESSPDEDNALEN